MDIKASLGYVLNESGGAPFAQGFYQLLFRDYPELRRHFEQTDLAVQQIILTNSLIVVVAFMEYRSKTISKYLELIGHRHALRGIPHEDYPKFHASMLGHLKDYLGDQWTDRLHAAWDEALSEALAVIQQGHEPGAGRY
ncbi:MAG: globin domain-containing protein [Pirellulales bacterium]|nr:globin domain-containing protein [Pirellulales bacterium]